MDIDNVNGAISRWLAHSPNSQPMNAWEVVTFTRYSRQSQVVINQQRDLEDMLTKLDRPKEGLTEQEENKRLQEHKRKRKFLELALPVGVLSLLCIACSLLYLVEAGQNMTIGKEITAYYEGLKELDICINAIVDELTARNTDTSHKEGPNLDDVYETTNKALFKIVPGRSNREWKIRDKLDKHSNNPLKKPTVTEDGMFYAAFILDVLEVGSAKIMEIDRLSMWRSNFEYIQLSQQIFSIKTMLIVMDHTCSTSLFRSLAEPSEEVVDFIDYTGLALNKMKMNDSSETTQFLRNSNAIFGNMSAIRSNSTFNNDSLVSVMEDNTCDTIKYKLDELYAYKLNRRDNIFIMLVEKNSVALRENIVLFCCIFLAIILTTVCIVGFGYLLRYECQVSVGVSDWLESVMAEVKDQELYHESIFKRICPQGLRDDFAMATGPTMIPYYMAEATMAMLSIASFKLILQKFTASQTVQVLSFVMDLLDERMAQYSVFSVTMSVDKQIIISDSVYRRDWQHACAVSNMALDVISCCSDLEIGNGGGSKLQLKIGIHTGPCVGMLYRRKGEMVFKITGHSVKVLQKLHRLSLPNRIQVTDVTHRYLSKSETYSLQSRGHMEVEGISQHTIYWLNGRKVSVSAFHDNESHSSMLGSWIELEKKPLYRLDEDEGAYTPLDKSTRRHMTSLTSYKSADNDMDSSD